MKINPRFLRTHRFLSLLPSATVRKLASGAGLRDFPKGSVVFSEGDSCAALYLILSGRCESRHLDATGHAVTSMHGPGEILGDREVMHHEPYLSTVTVATQSVLLRIPAEDLREVIDTEPKVAGRISQSISRRILEKRAAGSGKRIVALHALAGRIPQQALGAQLADILATITRRPVLNVRLTAGPAPAALADLAEHAPAFDSSFRFSRAVREVQPGRFELAVRVSGESRQAGLVAPLLGHLGSHFDFVLIDPGDAPPPVRLECLVQADLAYILVRPEPDALDQLKSLMGSMSSLTGFPSRHVHPIVCGDDFDAAARFSEECEQSGHPVHSILHGVPGRSGPAPAPGPQLRRIAREIGRCRVGLALSSGGARGLAHIGVIQVLEENGIEIDAVAGCSMGAYVGAVWAYGHNGFACEKIARDLERRWGLLRLVDPVIPPRQGFLRTRRVARRLRRAIGATCFVELDRPLRIVATDLETLDRVVFSHGQVALAVEASIAIPGVCVPVSLGGRQYIDGGISDPLPADVLSEMGVERIIAVNTLPTPGHLANCTIAAPPAASSGLGALLNKHLNYFARGNLCDILMRANFGGQMRVAEQTARICDVVLRPWTCDSRWHDFTNPGKYISLGRKVAEERLAEIKALTVFHTIPHEIPAAALALPG